MNYCSCSFTDLVFVLNCITEHGENYASGVTLLRTFSTSPTACWCCSSSNLYPETRL